MAANPGATTITHPSGTYTASLYLGGGIADFRDGRAVVTFPLSVRAITELEEAGFTVGEPTEPADQADPVADLESRTVAELHDYADAWGIEVPSKAKKAELVQILAEAETGD